MKKIAKILIALSIIVAFPLQSFAALAIDASSPARSTAANSCISNGSPSSVTTATFNPPANSALIVVFNSDGCGSSPSPVISISNNGSALTWVNAVKQDKNDTDGHPGVAGIWYSTIAASRTGMTVTATASYTAGMTIKVYVITGADLTDPIGDTAKGHSTTNNLTTTAYTSTVANSLGIAAGTDWNALGTPASTDVADEPFHLSGAISGLSVHKSALTTTAGTSVTFNLNAATTAAADWNWVSAEIVPDTTPVIIGPTYPYGTGPSKFRLLGAKLRIIGGKLKLLTR